MSRPVSSAEGRGDEVLMCSLLSCQPAFWPARWAGLAVSEPDCWLIALFTGVGLSHCSVLTFTLIYDFLLAAFPPLDSVFPCMHAVDQTCPLMYLTLPPLHKQGHPVSTADIALCKQAHDMLQMCGFVWSLTERNSRCGRQSLWLKKQLWLYSGTSLIYFWVIIYSTNLNYTLSWGDRLFNQTVKTKIYDFDLPVHYPKWMIDHCPLYMFSLPLPSIIFSCLHCC